MKIAHKTLIAVFSLTMFSFNSLAAVGEGTINEIRVCGATSSGVNSMTYFKLSDGQWFWIHTDFPSGDQDGNDVMSVILSAHAARYKVKVNLTQQHAGHSARCNTNAVAGYAWSEGDFISIVEFSE